MQVLIIDNYDSFTFNLYQLVGEITGLAPTVVRNDSMPWDALIQLEFDCVIISPGPGHPGRKADFGLSRRAILDLDVPVLGVCLGHQGICHAFGGSVIHAPEPVHGRRSSIFHDGSPLFAGVPSPFSAVRYHSLACARPLPPSLVATAWTADGIVMALAHRTRPIAGVQFHPESIATEHGRTILKNFLGLDRPAAARATAPPVAAAPSQYRCFVRRIAAAIDPEPLFASLFAHLDYAFWLDSSLQAGDSGTRFSFMGGAPAGEAETVSYSISTGKLVVRNGEAATTYSENVLAYLDRILRERKAPQPEVPFDFNCGYVGYFGYELNLLCGASAAYSSPVPDCFLLFAGRCIAIDHQAGEVYLLYFGGPDAAGAASAWFDNIVPRLSVKAYGARPASARSRAHFTAGRARDTYLRDISRCLEKIRDGESYEVCLTNRLRAGYSADPFEFYCALRRVNPSPYAAYLKFPGLAVACSSPERFLKVRPGGAVESKPIKGTSPRGRHAAEDEYLRERLAMDIKSQAENLMIVDLLRNDLGRVCEVGSVAVPSLMQVESYATVHQLVSTITGQLKPEHSAVDCFRAAFPPGSMTGAPKIRTMGIIDELEGEARGIYSGAIGYFALNGAADLNVVIRTAVFSGNSVTIGTGGAVVAMSDPAREWNEILLKAEAVLSAFRAVADTTTGWQDGKE